MADDDTAPLHPPPQTPPPAQEEPPASDPQSLKRPREDNTQTPPLEKKLCVTAADGEKPEDVAMVEPEAPQVEERATVDAERAAQVEAEGEGEQALGQEGAEEVNGEKAIDEDGAEDGAAESDEEEAEKPESDSTDKKPADREGGKGEVKLGPMLFTTSLEMFNYFYELLHGWPLNFSINKYEYMVLLDLIQKGHPDPSQKVGVGIEAFQIRTNPEYYSRCYYLIRKDGTMENFSYRKCVDKLLPLPEHMKFSTGEFDLDKIISGENDSNKNGKRKSRGGHGGGRGGYRGRGGRFGGGRGRGGRRN